MSRVLDEVELGKFKRLIGTQSEEMSEGMTKIDESDLEEQNKQDLPHQTLPIIPNQGTIPPDGEIVGRAVVDVKCCAKPGLNWKTDENKWSANGEIRVDSKEHYIWLKKVIAHLDSFPSKQQRKEKGNFIIQIKNKKRAILLSEVCRCLKTQPSSSHTTGPFGMDQPTGPSRMEQQAGPSGMEQGLKRKADSGSSTDTSSSDARSKRGIRKKIKKPCKQLNTKPAK